MSGVRSLMAHSSGHSKTSQSVPCASVSLFHGCSIPNGLSNPKSLRIINYENTHTSAKWSWEECLHINAIFVSIYHSLLSSQISIIVFPPCKYQIMYHLLLKSRGANEHIKKRGIPSAIWSQLLKFVKRHD